MNEYLRTTRSKQIRSQGKEKSAQMHEKLAVKIDRKNAQTNKRAQAKAERLARKLGHSQAPKAA